MLYDFGSRTKAFNSVPRLQFEADDDFKYTKAKGYSFFLNNGNYVRFSGAKDGLHMKYLHKVLMKEPDGLQIDHIDGNPLNNCLDNLRVATNSQNQQNKTKMSNNKCGYKNVYLAGKKWRIRINGKHYGSFATVEEANAVATAKRPELCGEFARD